VETVSAFRSLITRTFVMVQVLGARIGEQSDRLRRPDVRFEI